MRTTSARYQRSLLQQWATVLLAERFRLRQQTLPIPEDTPAEERRRIEDARADPNAFIEYVFEDDRGRPMRQAPQHRAWQEAWTRHDRHVLVAHAEAGKALPVDTPIPTPSGFRPIGDLRVGDVVFGCDGLPCAVTGAFPVVHDHELYELELDDGTRVVADAEHLWWARSAQDRAKGYPGAGRRYVSSVVTTREIARTLRVPGRNNWTMPVPGPVHYPARALPVDPYTLGVWLGNGARGTSRITFDVRDSIVYERCRAAEGACEPKADRRRPNVRTATIGPSNRNWGDGKGLKARLRCLGLEREKFIPTEYLVASLQQRQELLAGLLDTDGTIDGRGKNHVEYTSVDRPLADGVLELLRSLGFKAAVSEGRATLNGKDCGPKYRVTFTTDRQVFLNPRKGARVRFDRPTDGTTRERVVIAARRVPSVPVRCIAVDAPDRLYLATRDYLVTHNTSQLGARLTWELGRDPTQRILLLGATIDNPKKVLAVIRRAIGDPGEEGNQRLRKVFPQLLPGHPWNSRELNLLGHVAGAKDYSVQTAGLNTHIMGGRFDKIVADDLHNSKNSATETMRQQMQGRFDNEVQSRVTDRGSLWVLGNAWHRHDVPHTLGSRAGWTFDRFPLLDERYRSRWPEQFPQARIAKLRATFGGLAFARMYLCIPLDDETQRFQQPWLDAAVERGRRINAPWRPSVRPVDASGVALPTFAGVDFASGKSGRRRKTDQSAVFVWARHPNGDLQVLDLREGKWTAPTLVDQLQEVQRLYDPIFWAEDNATQNLFIELWRKDRSSPRVRSFTTGVNKYDPITGIEGLSIDAEAGRWIVPSVPSKLDPTKTEVPPEIAAWFQALLYYSPADHPGDSVIASWLATMSARLGASQMFFQENRALR